MATYQGGFEVPAPPFRRRSRGLLLDVAEPFDLTTHPLGDDGERGFDDPQERVIGGVHFCGGNACIGVDRFDNLWCADAEDEELPWAGEGYEFPDATESTFGTFSVTTAEQAPGRLRTEWLRARAAERIRERWSAQVANELLTGATAANPSLQSEASHVVQQVTAPDEVPFVVEDILAGFENLGFVIHMDPGTFTVLAEPWGYEQDDKESTDDPNRAPFRTPTGHIVVADAGYRPGPDDDFAPDTFDTTGEARWIYASLMPHVWLGDEREVGVGAANFDRLTNKTTLVLERSVLVAFDPCVVVAIQVDVPTYDLAPLGS